MSAVADPVPDDAVTTSPARVGPNAVIQLGHALNDLAGPEVAKKVFSRAGVLSLLHDPPGEMIEEAIPALLFATLWSELDPGDADPIARDAGRRTADYIIANRIPAVAKRVLRLVPKWFGARLLLQAIQRNAWTFAGSGTCRTRARPCLSVTITHNPLTMPDCCWHQAVFERLFRELVSPLVRVDNTACSHTGAAFCRFEVLLTARKAVAQRHSAF